MSSSIESLQRLGFDYEAQLKLHKAAILQEEENASKGGSAKRSLVDTFTRDIRWVLDVPDTLEILIAQRNFSKAVDLHEQVNTLLKQNPLMEKALHGHPVKRQIQAQLEVFFLWV